MIHINDIQVILVLYKQKLEDSKSYISLKKVFNKQGDQLHLYIYDNSPTIDGAGGRIENPSNIKIEYVHDATNPGVSKAYNMGAQYALNTNKKWLLLLDQDSEFDRSIFDEFSAATVKYPENYLFAPLLKSGDHYISPCNYYLNKGFATKRKRVGELKNKFKSILNSGIFVEVSTFFKVGGYDENVPLYFSDFVFFKRYNKLFDSFVVLNSTIHHDLSDMSTNTYSNSLRTFDLFSEGARQASSGLLDYLKYSLVIGGRALVLSARYRSFKFIVILIRNYFSMKEYVSETNDAK